jgi:hypothetical protein
MTKANTGLKVLKFLLYLSILIFFLYYGVEALKLGFMFLGSLLICAGGYFWGYLLRGWWDA